MSKRFIHCEHEEKYYALATAFREYARMYVRLEKEYKKECQRSKNYKDLYERVKNESSVDDPYRLQDEL